MILRIKQRIFSWTDSFDIYDEDNHPRFSVRGDFLSLGHVLRVYDECENELGRIEEKLFHFFPAFDIFFKGQQVGVIKKEMSFFRPSYVLDYKDWRIEGDFWGWDYQILENNECVASISKEIISFTDMYEIQIDKAGDGFMALLVVLAIDAANCKGK